MYRTCRWLIVLMILLLGVSTVSAQSGDFIEVGHISDDQLEVEYPLELVRGDTVTLYVEALEISLDPIVTLLDGNGDEVGVNDDIDTLAEEYNSRLTVTALEDGIYTIVVSSWDATTGDYRLTVTFVETQRFEGTLNADTATQEFTLDLTEGDVLTVTAQPTEGDVNLGVTLFDAAGNEVISGIALTELRHIETAQFVVEITETGTYTVEVSADNGEGDFLLTVAFDGQLPADGRPDLAGSEQIRETEHFIIHYTLQGVNATREGFVDSIVTAVEQVWDAEINQMGWAAPPSDDEAGGDERLDVYVMAMCDEGEDIVTLASTGYGEERFDNPNTPEEETTAASTYLVLDNNYSDGCFRGGVDQILPTMAHIFHYAVQAGYDADEPMFWYGNATATWIESQVGGIYQDATGYVRNLFGSPELCLGTTERLYAYSHWVFIQSLVEEHGEQIVFELWDNIRRLDNFTALERTLDAYDEDVSTAVARYWLRNVARDYPLVQDFNSVVALEDIIQVTGDWMYAGEGVQELGANFFRLDLPAGNYSAILDGNSDLQLWAIGIQGQEAQAFQLGEGVSFSVTDYAYLYLMVFNTDYDSDVDECRYQDDYSITVTAAEDANADVLYTWDATYFSRLTIR